MKRVITLFLLFTTVGAIAQNQLQTPAQFLGYELGDRFTRHHRIVEYYQHVAEAMPNVKLVSYGETNEHRPLIVAMITSQRNFDRLEEIRLDNLRRAGLADGTATSEEIAIVWLSYNVHGNESSSSEATMLTLYELANPENTKTQEWLSNTVVILDPCINPDGRDRYANFFNQYGSRIPNPNLDAKEHREPWPGGRTNHYLFDLNRDWAWLTQVESRGRIKLYNEWLPHVHVDFHEQSLNNPYYFPPAAEPYHEIITPWQREFEVLIGKNHARYFDENGWIYFTKEVFDLFYPSYGDTYPTYNGAIGMTYEKGGGGLAGIAGLMNNGDTVKLSDRLLHHHTTGLSTVEVSSANASRLVQEFRNYFTTSTSNPQGRYKTYVIKGTSPRDNIRDMTQWLDEHKIQYGTGASTSRKLTGFNYRSRRNESVSISANDIVINVYQPKSNLITALFEPEPKLVDSMTYDITSWAVPYAYGLEAYAIAERLNPASTYAPPTPQMVSTGKDNYAYIGKYQSLDDVKWLSYILNKGLKVRVARKDFAVEGNSFAKGSMVALRWDNEHLKNFDEIIKNASKKFRRSTIAVKTGLVDQGKDFGSRYYQILEAPKVALLAGNQVRSYDFGQVWYFFEQDIEYPVTVIDTDYFSRMEKKKYDVIVVPGGSYSIFNEETRNALKLWVREGGRLIVMAGALRSFVNTDQFGLKQYRTEDEEKEAETKEEEDIEANLLTPYDETERRSLSERMPGAVYRVKMDNTHPLAFGYPGDYFSLKLSSARYAYLEEGWNVGVIESPSDLTAGFVGNKIKEQMGESLVFGVEDMGAGSVVYIVDNPLFRAFWHNGKMIFGNAVFIR